MKNWLYVSAALLAIGVSMSARAADMAVKVPPAPVPAWTWSGYYAGLNLGYGIGSDPGGFNIVAPGSGVSPTPERFNYSPAGVIGGGQIGINWQVDPHWVWGAEADLQGSGQSDHFTCVQQCLNVPGVSLNGTTVNQQLNWFATARSRLGWSNGPALWYATAGFAVGEVRTAINTIQQASPAVPFSFNDTKGGFVLGGGLEYRLWGNWTAKAEYLYIDLGTISHTFTYPAPFPSINTYESHVRDSVVRLGLNYKFGDPGMTPAVAAPASPAVTAAVWNWTGFHAGANAGGGLARDPTNKIGIFNTTGNPILDESYYLMPRGVIGGGQIGYDWQVSSIVLGAEADFQFSSQTDSTTCATFCDPTPGGSIALVGQKLPWIATARGRLGWTNGPGLVYVTGGAAFARVETSITESDLNGAPLVLRSFDFSTTRSGFALGGGVEHQIAGNWTAKAEYLYADFGGVSTTYANPAPPSVFATTHHFSSSIRDNIIRAGVNYKFGTL
jgi:outer membrane immunogenic protein